MHWKNARRRSKSGGNAERRNDVICWRRRVMGLGLAVVVVVVQVVHEEEAGVEGHRLAREDSVSRQLGLQL